MLKNIEKDQYCQNTLGLSKMQQHTQDHSKWFQLGETARQSRSPGQIEYDSKKMHS